MKIFDGIILFSLLVQIYSTQVNPYNIYNCLEDQTGAANIKCEICSAGKIPSADKLGCYDCPSLCKVGKCVISNNSTKCTSCIDGYTLNLQKTCIACGSNCKSCTLLEDGNIDCTTCFSNSYKEISNSISQCKLCSSSLTGCKACSDQNTCNQCLSGYTLSDSKCISCANIHHACIDCDEKNQCVKCKTGFVLKDNLCIDCPRNCDSCEFEENFVKCNKCKAYHTNVGKVNCNNCPDNCLECELINGNLVCKDDKCLPKYGLTETGSCNKCPDNCLSCSWNRVNSRLECNGNSIIHSCIENEQGKSWARKTDGSCVACPENCLKCYFKTDQSSSPICYPSKCNIKYGFDDSTSTCFSCPSGCDYCKKVSTGNICLKCSFGYAPKYNVGSSTIESCKSCSAVNNCDYCEVINNIVKCLRSPCASKSSGQNRKFSFNTKQCSDSCPSDSGCKTQQSIVDEGDYCYCRDCPLGSAVILSGQNSGVCKSCGIDCIDCQLTADKTDVQCKTCRGTKQYIAVFDGSNTIFGCYDCTNVRQYCHTLDISSGSCKCKSDSCIGDSSNPTKKTVIYDSTSGVCKSCREVDPNGLWCSGNFNSFTLDTCMGGYKKITSPSLVCRQIPNGCAKSTTNIPVGETYVQCEICGPGYYLDPSTKKCPSCSSGSGISACEECFLKTSPSSQVVCTKCSNTSPGVGYNCNTPCTSSVANCENGKSWAQDNTGSNCGCTSCLSTHSNTGGVLATNNAYSESCLSTLNTPTVPNCATYYGNPVTGCSKCSDGYAFASLANGCVGDPGYSSSCKSGYLYFTSGTDVACEVPSENYMTNPVSNLQPILVDPADRAPTNVPCLLYLGLGGSTSSDARCAQCPSGSILSTIAGNLITKYTCQTCPSLSNCELVASHSGNCRCGACGSSPAGSVKLILPDNSNCKTCAVISSCLTHSLRLKDGNYECVCSQCIFGKHLSKDFLSCIDCSSITCTGGTVQLSNDNCICSCSSGKLLNRNNDGCISCSNSEFTDCVPNSFLLKQDDSCDCSTCPPYSIKNRANNKCLNCAEQTTGFVGNCSVCTESTSTPDSIDVCNECQDGFSLNKTSNTDKGNCVACDNGCKTCNIDSSGSTANKCTKCNAGFALNNAGTCLQCPENCGECRVDTNNNLKTLCLQFACSTGGLVDKDFTCGSCPANCAKCVKDISNNVKCLICNDATYLDSDGSCKSCINDCSFCIDGVSCLPNGCKDGFIRHRTQGICIQCSGAGVSRCVYQTIQDDILIPKTCKEGFKFNANLNPDACEECATNCKKCDSSGKGNCDPNECRAGYFYDSTTRKCYKVKEGCLTSARSTNETICQSCDKSISVFSSGLCKTCPEGCDECFVSSEQTILCRWCKKQYYRLDSGLCSSCPEGCKECFISGGNVKCSSCLNEYALNGQFCTKCVESNCNNCEMDGNSPVCKECFSKFYLNNEQCGECPKFCSECSYDNKYVCNKCIKKYARDSNGICVACPSSCEECSVDANDVAKCSKCDSNAFSLQQNGTCISCKEATFSTCATCGPAINGSKVECLTCDKGYGLQDDKLACLPCSISNCDLCSHGRRCSKCKAGFYLHNYDRECAKKCYECKGSLDDCGTNDRHILDDESKVKLIDCGTTDCWVHRREVKGVITFERSCSHEVCTADALNEICSSNSDSRECKKCCKTTKCNSWFLDGKAGVNRLNQSYLTLILSIIFKLITSFK
ncbi:DgyrCDS843 [Dimorphilus gyrociliatus]|uniref:DgyrCDS843 n=1 Tax=Dimorphilus gyrociliatus TaxID=2664684 RepID=A0A7I8V7B7_9ANNE|nr:DgyrCDS843 [Dimorphilus gyrociliatus]